MNTTKQGHTPTPWKQGGFGLVYGPGNLPRIDGGLDHNEAVPVLEVKNGAFGTQSGFAKNETSKANAAFIVKAVNCHEELLAVCKAVLDSLNGNGEPMDDRDRKEILRQAINRAEQE